MKYYIYYYKNNKSGKEDAAIVEANIKKEAIEKFKKYYVKVPKYSVQKLNLNRKNFVQDIMILTEY